MAIEFKKMHGLGNDFVIVDERVEDLPFTEEEIRIMSQRRRGIGCDQFIVLTETVNKDKADIFMKIFNPDGSEAGACGNATRCVADLMMTEKKSDRCVIETVSGFLECWRADEGMVKVDMGAPRTKWQDIPLSRKQNTKDLALAYEEYSHPVAVNVGNPHCVFFVDDVSTVDLEKVGPKIEHHPFFPARTNVEFVQVIDDEEIRVRVWERGTGVTEACGSGACASGYAAFIRGNTSNKVAVELDGGTLWIEIREEDGHILMTGPFAHVYDGKITI